MTRDEDARRMRRALELAERGWGRVSPNPLVGAVLVREGRVVGEGWHAEFGGEHAEVAALREAGDTARGATLYVTLEPCAHEGKTPACTAAILEAGVRRVVAACRDPHPDARGGLDALAAAGVDAALGPCREAAARLNAPFLWSERRETPFTTLKLALSLDARIAARPGQRTPVTGPGAAEAVHRLRAGHDAVLVGRRTAETDDPRLTARGAVRPRRPPVRVVLDPGARLGTDSVLARTAHEAPVWVLAGPDAPADRRDRLGEAGVRVETVPLRGAHALDLSAAWRRLREGGVRSLLVEGGGRVASSVLRGDLAQRLHLFYAPRLFGPGGVEAFPDATPDGGPWRVVGRRAHGDDTALVLEPPGLAAELAGAGAQAARSGPEAAGAERGVRGGAGGACGV